MEYQNHIFDALFAAGEDLGLKPFGIRAMDALRVEKSYKLIGQELSIEYAPMNPVLTALSPPIKATFWVAKGYLSGAKKDSNGKALPCA